jgi:hypothetical protein
MIIPFACSLCHHGILGGGLFMDGEGLTYKTGKVTVNPKYRNLKLRYDEMDALSWKWIVFPVATFTMKNGETYRFIIFNKWRFTKAFGGIQCTIKENGR